MLQSEATLISTEEERRLEGPLNRYSRFEMRLHGNRCYNLLEQHTSACFPTTTSWLG
jgi:hypothetical protein